MVIHGRRQALPAILVLLALGSAGCVAASAQANSGGCSQGMKLTTSATGTASGPPDLLTIDLTVATDGSDAQAALSNNSDSAQKLITAIEGQGVMSSDIQTSNLSISPNYNYPQNGTPSITGYHVENSVTVTLRGLASAGSVIDAAASAAGNSIRIDSFSFSVQRGGGLASAARTGAVKNALSQAKAMASAAGVSTVSVCSIADNASTTPMPQVLNSAAARPAALPPVQPGSQQVTASVTVVYSLSN